MGLDGDGLGVRTEGYVPGSFIRLAKVFSGHAAGGIYRPCVWRFGNRPAAEKIQGDLLANSKKKYVSPYDIAVTYAGLDDKGQTFEWLEKAYQEHSAFMVYMSSDPRFRPLRGDARFKDLLGRMGYPNEKA